MKNKLKTPLKLRRTSRPPAGRREIHTSIRFYKYAATLLLICTGCGFYSFSGSLAPHLNTVAVPLFENRTAEFGITEDMTDIIIEEFTRDNTLKISDRSGADVLIEGVILRINDRAGGFDAQERVQDYKIYLTVSIKCTDQQKQQLLWEERITQWGSFDPSAGPESRNDGIAEAIEKISQEVLNKTVSGW
jgi:hypothetical protein